MKNKNKLLFKPYWLPLIVLVFSGCRCQEEKFSEDSSPDPADPAETNDDSLDIASEVASKSEANNYTACPTRRVGDSNVQELTDVQPKEFPFIAAILDHEKEFICSGTVVANGIIVTAAHCLVPPPGYVMLNSVRIPSSKDDAAIYVNVEGIEQFPTFIKSNTGKSSNDVGLILTEKFNKSVASMIPMKKYSDFNIIVDFMAIGYGLNAELGSPKLLQQVIVNHRPMYDLDETFTGYIDCIDTNISTCFKDTGGPALFGEELIGVVVSGQDNCTKEITSEYAINKLMVRVLPTFVFNNWLTERIKASKTASGDSIAIHPMKPVAFARPHKRLLRQYSSSSSMSGPKIIPFTIAFFCNVVFLFS